MPRTGSSAVGSLSRTLSWHVGDRFCCGRTVCQSVHCKPKVCTVLQSAGRTFAHCAYWLLEQEQTRFGEVRQRRRPFRSSLNGESISAAALADSSADRSTGDVRVGVDVPERQGRVVRLASPRLARGRQWARSRPFCAAVDSQPHAIENAQTRLESGLVCLFGVCFCRASHHSQ